MIELQKISYPQLEKYVALAYENDIELMAKFHVEPDMPFEKCVSRTMEMIKEVEAFKKPIYYKILHNKQPIGYVATFDNFLYSFGINQKFRKKDILIAWFNEVKRILKGEFFSMLYANNQRAILFLIRNGMKVLGANKENNTISFGYGIKEPEYV